MTSRLAFKPPQELTERHRAFWQRSLVAKPLVRVDSVSARIHLPPVKSVYGKEADIPIRPQQADVDRYLSAVNWEQVVTPGTADIFDVLPPYFRIPWLEAIAGCQIIPQPNSNSIWSKEPDKPLIEPLRIEPHTGWLAALDAQIQRLADDDGLPCPATQTLVRGPGDLAEAMLGAETLCLAMMDEADWLEPFLNSCTDLVIQVIRCQFERIRPIWGGYVNTFGLWSPEPCARVQEDVQRILTTDLYHRWLRPCLERIIAAFPSSIFHIHSGSLDMADEVTSVIGLGALQIAVDVPPYASPIAEKTDQLRQIQQKIPILIEGRLSPEEVDSLRNELSPEGLAIWARP